MSLFSGSKSALLVIDAQNVILENCFQRDLTIEKISQAVSMARVSANLVIWVQHSDEDIVHGSEDWRIVPALVPLPGEPIVHKHFRSSFVDTNLNELLQQHEISRLVICGAESNNCVRHTLHSALEIGYDVVLLRDAHTAMSFEWDGLSVDAKHVIDEQNLNVMNYQLPGRSAKAIFTSEVSF